MAQMIGWLVLVYTGRSSRSAARSGRWYVTIEYPFTSAAFRRRTEFVFS